MLPRPDETRALGANPSGALKSATREALMKGKSQYSWPPRPTCTNQFRSADFDIANIIFFLTKRANLMSGATTLSIVTLKHNDI